MQEFLISARQDLLDARAEWLKMLGRERRLAALTLEAYERDTRQFFQLFQQLRQRARVIQHNY